MRFSGDRDFCLLAEMLYRQGFQDIVNLDLARSWPKRGPQKLATIQSFDHTSSIVAVTGPADRPRKVRGAFHLMSRFLCAFRPAFASSGARKMQINRPREVCNLF
jgi:hypothetical protein